MDLRKIHLRLRRQSMWLAGQIQELEIKDRSRDCKWMVR